MTKCIDCGEGFTADVGVCEGCESDDKILDIRVAITNSLRLLGVNQDHKEIVDLSVDSLPDYFRT
jgi:hypothetical protein